MSSRVERSARIFVDATVKHYGAASALSRARMIAQEYRRKDKQPLWLRRALELLEAAAAGVAKPCPQCKGAKEIEVRLSGITFEPVSLPCPTCEGRGSVTPLEEAAHRAMQAMWCRCGNPSGDASYHPDAPGSKHHWTCDDCGKVTQVG